jgi:uncharacterized protein
VRTSSATTLWAVLGLILSCWLSSLTDGKGISSTPECQGSVAQGMGHESPPDQACAPGGGAPFSTTIEVEGSADSAPGPPWSLACGPPRLLLPHPGDPRMTMNPDSTRRDFLKRGAAAALGASLLPSTVEGLDAAGSPPTQDPSAVPRPLSTAAPSASPYHPPAPVLLQGPGRARDFTSRRPPPGERRFVSPAVEEAIRRVSADMADPEMAWLFSNCFPNTLDTTVDFGTLEGKPDTFVITGDIEAMWLRDSTAQVWPYLPLMGEDPRLQDLIRGVIHRQTRCILMDPYANAFNKEPGESPWKDDLTEMKPELHERKWEVDSLCYPIRLAHGYWKATGDASPFDAQWRAAMAAVLRTFREQQRKEGRGPYKFQRVTGWQTDTVAGAGYGNPTRPVGLIASIFRPSDDATIFSFLVPSNHFAVVALRRLSEITSSLDGIGGGIGDGADPGSRAGAGGGSAAGSRAQDRGSGNGTGSSAEVRFLAREALALAAEVEVALGAHAVVEHPVHGAVWAYEVDGFGNRHHMDDANVPSLLSLPYLGACAPGDPLYRRTRAFVLSGDNPYFFRGSAAEGVGSPHVGLEMIWPLAVTMRALTSTDDAEIARCLRTLKETHGGTGFMHESFHQDDPTRFTRSWFAWANTLFGELVLKVHRERPHLLRG